MKRITTLATVALLWAGAATASDFGSAIVTAYTSAGYSDIVVQHLNGQWLVTGALDGVTKTFLVDRRTGASVAIDLTSFTPKNHGAGHDAGDDHGADDAAGDDTGAGHDAGDDRGVDGAGRDAGDDHGGGTGDHDGGHDSDHGGDHGGSDD